MIPGSNLLKMASGLIKLQKGQYQPFIGLTTKASGKNVLEYGDATDLDGSIQPVPRSVYQYNGLDYTKEYITVFTSVPLKQLEEGGAGDRILWSGKMYAAMSSTPWGTQDGWNEWLCVCLGEIPPPAPAPV